PLTSARLVSGQFFQQRFGLLQVFGVKPLGEPVVYLRQHLSGFCLLALLLPQTSQTHRCPQFQRLRLLPAGNLNGLQKTLLGLCLRLGAGCWVLGAGCWGLRTSDFGLRTAVTI